jgi:hypothetical protein
MFQWPLFTNSRYFFDRWGKNAFENRDFQPNDLRKRMGMAPSGEPVNPAVFVWYAEVDKVD